MDNAPAGHQLCRLLTRGGRPARVCLEATGIYSLDLALALHRTPGIEVMVVNPRVTKDFMRARMHRTKTNATDEVAILEFVQRMPFRPWQPPAPEILAPPGDHPAHHGADPHGRPGTQPSPRG
jgi:transposase